uniref:Cupin n=1 Tax=Hymenolepis diminuta TaxID=6216 RepID=A0A0R3SZK0_HYMDI
LQFSKEVAAPGELVIMTPNLPHGHTDGDSINGTCLLSTIDVAIKNSDTAAN